jgi:hypothetical protein
MIGRKRRKRRCCWGKISVFKDWGMGAIDICSVGKMQTKHLTGQDLGDVSDKRRFPEPGHRRGVFVVPVQEDSAAFEACPVSVVIHFALVHDCNSIIVDVEYFKDERDI